MNDIIVFDDFKFTNSYDDAVCTILDTDYSFEQVGYAPATSPSHDTNIFSFEVDSTTTPSARKIKITVRTSTLNHALVKSDYDPITGAPACDLAVFGTASCTFNFNVGV